jgi:hypothetical protein
MEGRVLRSRGSGEVQTRQVQPSVGTPMDVPLPRIVISARWMKHAPNSMVSAAEVKML